MIYIILGALVLTICVVAAFCTRRDIAAEIDEEWDQYEREELNRK